jgi:cell fate regulator YaaT (PSP1 superfamily)
VGQEVIVETSRGVEHANVVVGPKEVAEEEIVKPLKDVLRPASAEDRSTVRDNRRREKQAFDICVEKIAKHKLDMQLVDVNYAFDKNKITFYFTADGRIDFRELVRDLASVFKTRIELRQIGVRDEAKLVGGIGPCGRSLCCVTWLRDFEPVSISLAKEQNLSLNPGKISGLCGRLMCCLRYEAQTYQKAREVLPEEGDLVRTPSGAGKVRQLDFLEKGVRVQLAESGITREFSCDEVETLPEEEHEAVKRKLRKR